jgi:hypothetical protein
VRRSLDTFGFVERHGQPTHRQCLQPLSIPQFCGVGDDPLQAIEGLTWVAQQILWVEP